LRRSPNAPCRVRARDAEWPCGQDGADETRRNLPDRRWIVQARSSLLAACGGAMAACGGAPVAAAAHPKATEARMKFGLFDHVEHGDRPLATLFDERLTFVQAAEEAGIYCLHVAEHHATPLNMVPVPGVYLGAVARATSRMRLGPLVYLLPLYSPLRLIEEICMLDHLSHGR